ncbi:MAG: DUF3006 domain-containing protein [Blastocatellia bacterium]
MAKKNENPETSIMSAVIDRVEEGLAVIALSEKDEIQFNLPLSLLPAGAKAGDWLKLTLALDNEGTTAARARVTALQAELTKDNDQEQMNIKL